MIKKHEKLSDMTVMHTIWTTEEKMPISVSQLVMELKCRYDIECKRSELWICLERLEKKKILRCDMSGDIPHISILITEEEYNKKLWQKQQSFPWKIYNSCWIDGKMPPEDEKEIREMLDSWDE